MATKPNREGSTPRQFGGEFLSPSELQDLLGIGKSTVYALLQNQLPTHKVGRLRRIRREDLEAWLSNNKCDPGSRPNTNHKEIDTR